MADFKDIKEYYEALKKLGIDDLNGTKFSDLLNSLALSTQEYLHGCNRIDLISKVPGKEYFSFVKGDKSSRAIRKNLFEDDNDSIKLFLNNLKDNTFDLSDPTSIDKVSYTIAIGFCAIIDLEKVGDQKTPGTFFEYFVGHCFAKRLELNPRKRVDILNLDMQTTLPTDFIFDMGQQKPKFHVPVKTSTRERVIQVWAHQRVLDGVYGTGRFMGILACLSETKVDKKKKEVVEICLPQQWQLYQMYIAQMQRVYYFDLPEAYAKLNESFPKIQVKTFSSFIEESTNFSEL